VGAPVSHGIVLAFFDYLRRRHPHIRDLEGIDRSNYDRLVSSFLDLVGESRLEDVSALKSDQLYIAITRRDSFFNPNHPPGPKLEMMGNRDDYRRYRFIDNHLLFFAAGSDYWLLHDYVQKYIGELHELSADFADIYFVEQRSGKWDVHGFELRRTLKSIPGISDIRNSQFPCLFLWSNDEHLILPLGHLQKADSLLKTYIRQIFDILEIRNRPLDREMIYEICDLPFSAFRDRSERIATRANPVDLFVSYKREDRRKIESLVHGLEQEGRRVWFDSALRAGDYFPAIITAQIEAATGIMPVWSSKSIESRFVQEEAAAGLEELIPVRIENVYPPLPFRQYHVLDLIDWDGSYQSSKWHVFGEQVAKWLNERAPDGSRSRQLRYSYDPAEKNRRKISDLVDLADEYLRSNPEKAKRLYEEALEISRGTIGPNHMVTLQLKDRFTEAIRRRDEEARNRAEEERARKRAEAERRRRELDAWRCSIMESNRAVTPIKLNVGIAHGTSNACFMPGRGKVEWFKDHAHAPEMVLLPADAFVMGSPKEELGGHEGPLLRVEFAHPFAVSRYAITRGEFAIFANNTNYNTDGGASIWTSFGAKYDAKSSWRRPGIIQHDNHPAVCVSWEDARAYVMWLSEVTGQTYRLLSEAEWEYMARAKSMMPFWWGASVTPAQANYNCTETYEGGGVAGEWRKSTVPVNTFEPNPWGVYNVHGNVWEWCEDVWHYSYTGAPVDGSAWTEGGEPNRHVVRGGAWSSSPRSLRSASRFWFTANLRLNYVGIRVARIASAS
jgi:formylglycine-generating enzyme required for sulfatase activity